MFVLHWIDTCYATKRKISKQATNRHLGSHLHKIHIENTYAKIWNVTCADRLNYAAISICVYATISNRVYTYFIYRFEKHVTFLRINYIRVISTFVDIRVALDIDENFPTFPLRNYLIYFLLFFWNFITTLNQEEFNFLKVKKPCNFFFIKNSILMGAPHHIGQNKQHWKGIFHLFLHATSDYIDNVWCHYLL